MNQGKKKLEARLESSQGRYQGGTEKRQSFDNSLNRNRKKEEVAIQKKDKKTIRG